ncbi:MAG TPA: VOC family protein [Jatrophihabitans sp.]|nr:VOC family protein [Jatrophihabitans sp.]
MPRFELTGVVLDAPDAQELGRFYQQLTGWPAIMDEPGWFKIAPEGTRNGISFQSEPLYTPPVWPSTTDHQQMQLHLDLRVDDLPAACAHAESLGAKLAGYQPQEDVRIYLDPVGHPFCLFEN